MYKVFSCITLGILLKARAKHDITNTVVAGCTTGGAISAKGILFNKHLLLMFVDVPFRLCTMFKAVYKLLGLEGFRF